MHHPFLKGGGYQAKDFSWRLFPKFLSAFFGEFPHDVIIKFLTFFALLGRTHPTDSIDIWYIHIHQEMAVKCSIQYRNAKNRDRVGTTPLKIVQGPQTVQYKSVRECTHELHLTFEGFGCSVKFSTGYPSELREEHETDGCKQH